jgi:hypothetical protein
MNRLHLLLFGASVLNRLIRFICRQKCCYKLEVMSGLLDAFTKFVAWLGDESARDGYLTGHNSKGVPTYSINVSRGVSPQFINQIVRMIHLNLTEDEEIKGKFSPKLREKIDEFVAVAKAGPDGQRAELLEYMTTYDATDYGMHGGARSRRLTKRRRVRGGKKTRSVKRR